MKNATIIALTLALLACFAADYDADGGLFGRHKRDKPRCTPRIQKPEEVPLPPEEAPQCPGTCPDGICEVPVVVDVVPDDPCADLRRRVEALEAIIKTQGDTKISQTDISIIVGEVLKKMPRGVAFYEIVPRTPKR